MPKSRLSDRIEKVKEFVDQLTRDPELDEITVTGAIATMPMGMKDLDSDERTPVDPAKTKTPGNTTGMKKIDLTSEANDGIGAPPSCICGHGWMAHSVSGPRAGFGKCGHCDCQKFQADFKKQTSESGGKKITEAKVLRPKDSVLDAVAEILNGGCEQLADNKGRARALVYLEDASEFFRTNGYRDLAAILEKMCDTVESEGDTDALDSAFYKAWDAANLDFDDTGDMFVAG
jgi:hypothetical protein